jgi:hypothetical protein
MKLLIFLYGVNERATEQEDRITLPLIYQPVERQSECPLKFIFFPSLLQQSQLDVNDNYNNTIIIIIIIIMKK